MFRDCMITLSKKGRGAGRFVVTFRAHRLWKSLWMNSGQWPAGWGQPGDIRLRVPGQRPSIHSPAPPADWLSTGPVARIPTLTSPDATIPRIHRPYYGYFLSISRRLRTK